MFTPRPPAKIGHILSAIAQYKPDLLTAWTASHFVFAGSMFLAPFVRSVRFASVIVAMCGMCVFPILGLLGSPRETLTNMRTDPGHFNA